MGHQVHTTRRRMGELLAASPTCEADIVMGVPDSGVPAAEGYAKASGIPFGYGLVKNRYIGRTFISPDQNKRAATVRRKLNPLRENIEGQRLIVVDDSIVRGTTTREIVKMLRDAGAKEVHLRISSPPFMSPCYFGIDTPTRDDLFAANHSIAEMNEFIGSDSLEFITLENLRSAIQLDGECCDACLTGNYPAPTPVCWEQQGSLVSRLLDQPDGGLTYAVAGVSIEAGEEAVERIKDVVASTKRPEVLGGIGGFGGLFALNTSKYKAPVLVASTDGVGTKLEVARQMGRYDTVGHRPRRDVGRRSRLHRRRASLHARLRGRRFKLDPARLEELVAGIAEGCRQANIALLGGETAEHGGVMGPDDLDVAGFAVGVLERGKELGPDRVREGDVLVGFASPGLRSNGYSLARRVLVNDDGDLARRRGRARTDRWAKNCSCRR